MSTTTLVWEFFRGVQTTLQDLNPPFRRWPEIELVRYTNFGQRALAKYLPQVGARVDTIELVAGTRQDLTKVLAADIKPGDGSTPADTFGIAFTAPVRNMGGDGLTAGRAIREPVDRSSKDAGDPNWHTATAGNDVREVVFDKMLPRVFYVSPPLVAGRWIELQWMAEPRRVTDGGAAGSERYTSTGAGNADLLGIPDINVDDLHNYVVSVCLLKGSKNMVNVPKAQLHTQAFTSSVNAQAQTFTGVSANLKALPFLSEIPAK